MHNIKWLEDYLTSLHTLSCLIVSHDSGFLDNVCTDIIHYEKRKLKHYRGNLAAFVKVRGFRFYLLARDIRDSVWFRHDDQLLSVLRRFKVPYGKIRMP